MEYKSHIWAGALTSNSRYFARIQERAKVLVNDGSISNSIDSLEHWLLACVTLFYDSYKRFLKRVYFWESCIATQHSHSATHSFVIDWPVVRTLHYKKNSFITQTVPKWRSLSADIFFVNYCVKVFKSRVHKNCSLYSIKYFPIGHTKKKKKIRIIIAFAFRLPKVILEDTFESLQMVCNGK